MIIHSPVPDARKGFNDLSKRLMIFFAQSPVASFQIGHRSWSASASRSMAAKHFADASGADIGGDYISLSL